MAEKENTIKVITFHDKLIREIYDETSWKHINCQWETDKLFADFKETEW